ncbi:hypothetical protein TNCV_2561991 [Trichonephila clavipes]|uniref:Uncharacterized protein n=1 Tax=Trichonephila clavipes TaxID=2585209 RepID=A0A8X6R5Q7_TRICX|nr:hypothetical protein TNCV_2561991 [Trichonephila clavipes]
MNDRQKRADNVPANGSVYCYSYEGKPGISISVFPVDTYRPYLKKMSCHVKCHEAHFWLNGYVNKQNCRIWSEANPQVYVETPLHPEKLTVWCALWAGGILLQKR